MGHWMLRLTPLAFLTGVFAAHRGLWLLTIAEWALVVSSVYYWSNHVDSLRRTIDIVVVQLSLYTHLYFAVYHTSHHALALYALGMGSYILGRYYDSDYAHAFVWLFGCAANIVLTNHMSLLKSV